jgi:hypothetical protein
MFRDGDQQGFLGSWGSPTNKNFVSSCVLLGFLRGKKAYYILRHHDNLLILLNINENFLHLTTGYGMPEQIRVMAEQRRC